MNQVTVTERDFDLAQRIAGVAGLYDFAGLYSFVTANPIAVGRNPGRVPNDFRRLALADVDRVLLHADADVVRLYFLAVLPKRQTKGRDVQGQPNVWLVGLKLGGFNMSASDFV